MALGKGASGVDFCESSREGACPASSRVLEFPRVVSAMEGGVARNYRRSGAKSMVPDAVLRVEPKPLHVGIRPSEAPTFGEDAGRASPAHADATLALSNCR